MENKLRTGFIAPKIEADHFVLGGFGEDPLAAPVIKVDGNWFKYLPSFESQLQKTFDSDGCTVYGTLNALETYQRFIENKETNYSDRFVYNAVGITPPGDDPHHVITVIRGSGLVLENDFKSEVDSLATFMTPRPLTTDLIVKGKQWFQKWMAPSHTWIITPSTKPGDKVRILKEQLLRGTVCISVCAWFQDQDGLYYSPDNMQNEHWTECYNVDDTGIYVFDSYLDARTGSFLKKLRLDHNIQYAKRYKLTAVDQTAKKNWLVDISNALADTIRAALKIAWEAVFRLEQKKAELPIEPVKKNDDYQEVKEAVTMTKIQQWAKLIARFEGAPLAFNNPGNFKYSPLIASYGGMKGPAGSDGGYFAKFPTYEKGMAALCSFLTLGCKNELLAYHKPDPKHPDVNPRTIKGFTLVYTNFPKPQYDYSDNLIKLLGVTADTDIKTFL